MKIGNRRRYYEGPGNDTFPALSALGYEVDCQSFEREDSRVWTFKGNKDNRFPSLLVVSRNKQNLGKIVDDTHKGENSIYEIEEGKLQLLKKVPQFVSVGYSVFVYLMERIFDPIEKGFWEVFATEMRRESLQIFNNEFLGKVEKEYFTDFDILIPEPIQDPPFFELVKGGYKFIHSQIQDYLVASEINKGKDSRFKGELKSLINDDIVPFIDYKIEGNFKTFLDKVAQIKNEKIAKRQYEAAAMIRDFEKRVFENFLKNYWPDLSNADTTDLLKQLEDLLKN